MRWTGERVVADDMRDAVVAYQEHLMRYVFALQYCSRKRVLDAACGTGYGSELIGTVADFVRGVDISSEALIYAQDHYQRPVFEQMDLEQPASASARYDVILSFETIEHLSDPHPFLQFVRNSLEYDGTFIWSIPKSLPNEFHKHVYDFQQAVDLITRHFPKTLFLRQDKDGVSQFAPEYGPYFFGVSRI